MLPQQAPSSLRKTAAAQGLTAAALSSFALTCMTACATQPKASTAAEHQHIDAVAELLIGHFNSAQQATMDERYYDISLRAQRIWPDNTDGYWLYVEQAVTAMPERPYRQRVYHLTSPQGPGEVLSEIYTLPDPAAMIGAWQAPSRFDEAELTPESLALREGCSITLYEDGLGQYTGSTHGTGCSTDLAGASYATSHVILSPTLLATWDRGWNTDGTQAWGADAGPYIFVRSPD